MTIFIFNPNHKRRYLPDSVAKFYHLLHALQGVERWLDALSNPKEFLVSKRWV